MSESKRININSHLIVTLKDLQSESMMDPTDLRKVLVLKFVGYAHMKFGDYEESYVMTSEDYEKLGREFFNSILDGMTSGIS